MVFSLFPKFHKTVEPKSYKDNFDPSNNLLNKKMFDTMFESSPDAVFTISINRQIQFFNRTLRILFNSKEEKLRFIFNQQILNIEIVKVHLDQALNGEAQSFQFEYVDRNNQPINLDVTIVPLFNNDYEVIAICGIAKDITNYVLYHNEILDVKSKLELAQATGKIGSWDLNILLDEIYWSEQFFKLTGHEKNDTFRPTLDEGLHYVHPEDREDYRKVLKDAINKSKGYDIEYRLLRKDNSFIYVYEHVEMFFDEVGNPIRLVGNTQDITERKLAEMKLVESNLTIETIYEHLSLGIISIDMVNQSTIMVSAGIEEVTGYPIEYFYTPQGIQSIVNPEDLHKYIDAMAKLTYGKTITLEFRIVHKKGNQIWVHGKFLPIFNDIGAVIRVDGIFTDITEQKQHQDEIHQLAYYDKLTGLAKTELFNEKIESLIEQKNPFSILYLEVERLRTINNTLGHAIVNDLLKEITTRIQSNVNQPFYFARLEGNEFGIILSDYNLSSYPEYFAESILKSLEVPFFIDGFEIYATASIGISNYSENGETLEELIKNADAALHRAKSLGKNNYHIFSSTLNISTYKQYELERDLRKALKNNQLILYFQSRVDTKTQKIVSAEALIRWEHPIWGIVSPGEFLSIAEEIGLINEIGDWVLQKVCDYLSKWKKEGIKIVPISINFIAQRFLRSDCIPMIVNTLKEYDIDSSLIELEITESSIIHHEQEVERILLQLKELGIKVALDDFGTGYSSLAHIKDFTINTIKLDKSFIQQIAIKQDVEIIIKSLIFMAKGLNMNIVAEGVETLEQYEFLKQQECTEIQGYLFSKPVPEEDFRKLLSKAILKPIIHSKHSEMKEKRNFYRIQLVMPLKATMTITSFKGNVVNLGKTEITIDNIGAGGLRFYSTIQLPVRPDIVYQFETVIMGKEVQVQGHIVWKDESCDGVYQYGISFNIIEKERQDLLKVLNNLTLKLKKNVLVHDTNFVHDDPIQYIKKTQVSKLNLK
ncbi:EAL domain-containing protein [Ureibacillus acetophenoni]|uniref:Diguanylate cyclase/phosphodiesterase with PAS/PAC sensor(S) n=1 Tax=Ureibacillus acetophenoni TaxID=614649 RepID=A0A285U9V0_9BACL|nr:EAL domain-containing protein [Ureibacillus acetophenoni]SOC37336.1 diguanylate cyclase/phosphodiesterase with PAS/PAC sensor(s) [Ureibacillus acetophenoni]